MTISDGIVLICTLGLVICIVQLVRLHFLSKLVRKAIDSTFEKRIATIGTDQDPYEIQYPNIDATYDGLKWYTFWKRPSTLLVFDKDI